MKRLILIVRNRPYIILTIHLVIMLLCLCGVALTIAFDIDYSLAIYILCITGTVLTLWCIVSWWALRNELFSPYILFLVCAILFNFGQPLLEAFKLNSQGILNGNFSHGTIFYTVLFGVLSFVAFHLGAIISVLRRSSPVCRVVTKNAAINLSSTRFVGWVLLGVSIVPDIIDISRNIATVMVGGYFAMYQLAMKQGVDSLTNFLSALIVPACLFLLSGSRDNKLCRWISLVVLCLHSICWAFLGARSAAFLPLIAYAWLWHRTVKPFSLKALCISAAIILVVLFPLIRVIRDTAGSDRSSVSGVMNSYSTLDSPIVAAISEMGGSMITVASTIELVPSHRPFDYGVGYLYAIRFITPNSLWSMQSEYPSYSLWLVWNVAPITAAMGGGLGYSFLAEAYINFGWVGGILFIFVIGYLVASFYHYIEKRGIPGMYAMGASFLASLLFFARSESMYCTRPLLWYALFPYALVHVVYYHLLARQNRCTERPGKQDLVDTFRQLPAAEVTDHAPH